MSTYGIIALLLIICYVLFADFGASLSKEEAKEYIDADWLQNTLTQEGQPSYLSLLDQRSNYTVDSIAKEDNYYVVTVTVSAPDVKKYLIENSVHLLENVDDFDVLIYDCVEAASITETVANIYIYEPISLFSREGSFLLGTWGISQIICALMILVLAATGAQNPDHGCGLWE